MQDTEQRLVEGARDAGLDTVLRLERFYTGTATATDREYVGVDEADGFAEVFEGATLEAVTISEHAWGTDGPSPVVGVRVVFGIGGPHIEATYRQNGSADVFAYWGGQTERVTTYAPETAAYLIDIAEGARQ